MIYFQEFQFDKQLSPKHRREHKMTSLGNYFQTEKNLYNIEDKFLQELHKNPMETLLKMEKGTIL